MKFRIETLKKKKLVGVKMRMSLSDNLTPVLWKSFMPRRNEILNGVSDDLISLQVYSPAFDVRTFNLKTQFDKWALKEVSKFENVPEGMREFILEGGMYGVFEYHGNPAKGAEVFGYIFGTWLPSSEYELDDRPHFEVLGEKYKNGSDDSEEEIYIPIKLRNAN